MIWLRQTRAIYSELAGRSGAVLLLAVGQLYLARKARKGHDGSAVQRVDGYNYMHSGGQGGCSSTQSTPPGYATGDSPENLGLVPAVPGGVPAKQNSNESLNLQASQRYDDHFRSNRTCSVL